MDDVAGPNGRLNGPRIARSRQLKDFLVCLFRGFYLVLAISGRDSPEQEGENPKMLRHRPVQYPSDGNNHLNFDPSSLTMDEPRHSCQLWIAAKTSCGFYVRRLLAQGAVKPLTPLES